jgi:hypothetical protein
MLILSVSGALIDKEPEGASGVTDMKAPVG